MRRRRSARTAAGSPPSSGRSPRSSASVGSTHSIDSCTTSSETLDTRVSSTPRTIAAASDALTAARRARERIALRRDHGELHASAARRRRGQAGRRMRVTTGHHRDDRRASQTSGGTSRRASSIYHARRSRQRRCCGTSFASMLRAAWCGTTPPITIAPSEYPTRFRRRGSLPFVAMTMDTPPPSVRMRRFREIATRGPAMSVRRVIRYRRPMESAREPPLRPLGDVLGAGVADRRDRRARDRRDRRDLVVGAGRAVRARRRGRGCASSRSPRPATRSPARSPGWSSPRSLLGAVARRPGSAICCGSRSREHASAGARAIRAPRSPGSSLVLAGAAVRRGGAARRVPARRCRTSTNRHVIALVVVVAMAATLVRARDRGADRVRRRAAVEAGLARLAPRAPRLASSVWAPFAALGALLARRASPRGPRATGRPRGSCRCAARS